MQSSWLSWLIFFPLLSAVVITVLPRLSGATIRWSFREITPDSFVWRAERSVDGERDWRPVAEFRARRV